MKEPMKKNELLVQQIYLVSKCIQLTISAIIDICHWDIYHAVWLAQISLTLSHHSSLSSIISSRFSRLNPMSVQSCYRKVLVGHLTLAHPCERVHRRTSLMSSSLLLQQCPVCLVHLIWIVLAMGGCWPYSCCFICSI